MANILLRVCVYHIFLSQLSVDGHLNCFHILAIVNRAARNIGFTFFLGIYPGLGLLDHMVGLFLLFSKETPYCFP